VGDIPWAALGTKLPPGLLRIKSYRFPNLAPGITYDRGQMGPRKHKMSLLCEVIRLRIADNQGHVSSRHLVGPSWQGNSELYCVLIFPAFEE
jgi:hypothetical protein